MTHRTTQWALAALLATVLLAAWTLQLHDWLTLDGVKTRLDPWLALRDASPRRFALEFLTMYVLVAAFSLPGSVVLTLAAGALFGIVQGVLLVSFGSSIGATLSFWASRYFLRDWIAVRWGHKLAAINAGIAREGAFYLFTLRLIPLIPFFVINLVMGLTPMRSRTFYLVSQLGMLAGTVAYVNAGTQLAQVRSVADIASPAIWLSLVLLGLLPWFAKKALAMRRHRQLYAKWQRPASFDRNLIVIGAGAAGLVTAYIAAAVKAKVTLVESHKMGGDCLNYGCVPSKALIKSATLAHQMRHAERYGLQPPSSSPSSSQSPPLAFSLRAVMQRVHRVIAEVAPHDSVERYAALGVEVLQGHGQLIDPWTVEVRLIDGSTRRLTARSIVIAAGARPLVPPLPGLDAVGYVTSDTLWEKFAQYEEVPRRLVVLGGGPIGCELAQSFARLGSSVIQIEMAQRILAREDREVAELVAQSLAADGVELRTGHKALRCEHTEADGQWHKYIVVEHAGQEVRLEFDELLCAVGRAPRLQGYGLETLGIPTQRTVETNAYLQTVYPNIYAAGDVAGPYQFTHTAAHQAWYAAVNALFGQLKQFRVDYSVVPWVTFTSPEVARVGLNESEAQEKSIAFEVTRYGIEDLDRAIADGSAHGFVKVLTAPGKDRILGVTIVAEHAGELLAEFVLAMKNGLGLQKILATIHAYPTLVEANKYAAGEWRRAHTPSAIFPWLERYHAWRRGTAP